VDFLEVAPRWQDGLRQDHEDDRAPIAQLKKAQADDDDKKN
jgi:hypothetical protein